jgi:nicotinamide mononucleotide adenylyltransferase
MKKYALYIGRWQTWHEGHRWLINQQLDKGKKVWIAIRDVEKDENNPLNAWQVMMELHKHLGVEIAEGRVMISIIPDIESFNYGRDVGYEVIEHQPPSEIREISGTKMRKNGIL